MSPAVGAVYDRPRLLIRKRTGGHRPPLQQALSILPVLLLATASLARGQGTIERDHFQVKIGATYDQGDFGLTEITKVLFVPITFRYLGNRYDVSVTPSFARVNGTGGVRLIDGVPTPTGEQSGSFRDTASAAGDTVVRGRYYLVEENGLNVSPFVKVKIPTAPEDLNLGTGKTDVGFGIEVDKQMDSVLLFGDLSYTVTGKIPGLRMRNRTGASFGIGKNLSDSLLVSGMVDWRRSLIAGNADPTELVGILTYKVQPRVTISPNAYGGLNSSSADFGFGVEIGFRFWRY